MPCGKKYLTAFCFILALQKSVFCQHTEYIITHYDETSGLESNIINAMLQDSKGYLWFGTADGLCRYDGYNFQTFRKKEADPNSLPGNYIYNLAEDKDGKIWISTLKDGIGSYDPASGRFRNYDVRDVDRRNPLVRAVKMLFIDSDNNVWAGLAQKGLIKLDKRTGLFSQYNIINDTNRLFSAEFKEIYNNVYAMCEQAPGKFWLATHDGLYKFNAFTGDMTAIREKTNRQGTIRDDLFNTMAVDKSGLWLGGWAGGLSHYDTTTGKWSNYKFNIRRKNISTTNIIGAIVNKNDNELLIASFDKGFGVFNKQTHHFNFFSDSVPGSIPSFSCSGLMIDKQHNTWIACVDGLVKIKQTEKRFEYVPIAVSRNDNGEFWTVSCMLEDKAGKYLYTGTSFADGLHVTNKLTGAESVISFATIPGEESALVVNDLMEDSKGRVWVLTRDYIYLYDPMQAKLINIPQPDAYMNGKGNYYTVIREDKAGVLWIASARNGVFAYNTQSKKYQHYFDDHAGKSLLTSNVITGLTIDGRGRVWVGGTRGCFGYIDNVSRKFINLDRNGHPSVQNSDNRLYTLYTDKNGDILAGTDAGLYCYDVHAVEAKLSKVFNNDNGLRGDIVTSIREDRKGDLWCVTSSALCNVIRQSGKIINYRKQDGIEKVNLLNGVYSLHNGQMTAFAARGYYLFNPAPLLVQPSAIPLIITSFKVDNVEQYADKEKNNSGVAIVPARANVVSFEFAALDFDRPDKQQYIYMLQGFDKDWVSSGQRRYAGYANLSGGDYVFKVKSNLSSGSDKNATTVSLAFHVEEPFYKTWWFITGLVGIVFLSAWLFYRFKLNKQRQIDSLETKAQMLKKEKALAMYEGLKQQLNPHFLFNSLSSLNSLIVYDHKLASEFLEELSGIYRYILKSRDHETVELPEEIRFVQTYIRLQQTRFGKGLEVLLDTPKDADEYQIVPVTLQNLIENAIKHNIIDEDSPLLIHIYKEDNYLVAKNNKQKKNFVETSNKQGLVNLTALYRYLSNAPVIIQEDDSFFTIKIPLLRQQ